MGCNNSKDIQINQARAPPAGAAAKAGEGPPMIQKDLIVDMSFEVVTDLETTWKYNINRKQMLEMFNGCEDGKAIVKDENANSWTFEKTDENGAKSHNYFMNEVCIENKQFDKDIKFTDEKGNVKFTIHSTYIFTACENGTRI